MVSAGHDQDRYLLAVEHAERRDRKMVRAVSPRQESALAQARRMHCHVVVAEVAVEQRSLDVLPLARALAMEQRSQDRAKRMHAGADVADANLRQRRRAVAIADHAEYAGIGAADEIITRTIGERAALAKRGNRAHDDLRVNRARSLVGEPESSNHARSKILDHHIHLRDKFLDDCLPGRVPEIQAEALLAPILLHVICAASVAKVWYAARDIAVGSDLDFDYIGPEFRQIAGGSRSGEDLREIQHPVAIEHGL